MAVDVDLAQLPVSHRILDRERMKAVERVKRLELLRAGSVRPIQTSSE